MYQTNGVVSVGVRYRLPTVADALKLPFVRFNAEPASEDEITSDYSRVYTMNPGSIPSAYRRMSSLLLPKPELDRLLVGSILHTADRYAAEFASFNDFTTSVRAALVDLAIFFGFDELKAARPVLWHAIGKEDWKTAALESRRKHAHPQRNKWVRDSFLAAVPVD